MRSKNIWQVLATNFGILTKLPPYLTSQRSVPTMYSVNKQHSIDLWIKVMFIVSKNCLTNLMMSVLQTTPTTVFFKPSSMIPPYQTANNVRNYYLALLHMVYFTCLSAHGKCYQHITAKRRNQLELPNVMSLMPHLQMDTWNREHEADFIIH